MDIPFFKGVSGMATTKQEALEILEEAIEEFIEHQKERGGEVPKPKNFDPFQDESKPRLIEKDTSSEIFNPLQDKTR